MIDTDTDTEPQGEQVAEQRLVDLVGKGEAAARITTLRTPIDHDTTDLFALECTLRFDLATLAEVRAVNRAIPCAEMLYLRGQNTSSNEKFKASREADDQLKIELWGIEIAVDMIAALFRTSKVETVLSVKLKGGGLTIEQITEIHRSARSGGLAPFGWEHAQTDLFADTPGRYEPTLPIEVV